MPDRQVEMPEIPGHKDSMAMRSVYQAVGGARIASDWHPEPGSPEKANDPMAPVVLQVGDDPKELLGEVFSSLGGDTDVRAVLVGWHDPDLGDEENTAVLLTAAELQREFYPIEEGVREIPNDRSLYIRVVPDDDPVLSLFVDGGEDPQEAAAVVRREVSVAERSLSPEVTIQKIED